MELTKDKFKKSEIGYIPKDWQAIPIGCILKFKNGLNKEKEYFGKGTPIVNYMDVLCNPGLHTRDINGKVTLTKEEIRNYQVKKGDVFFTRTSETVDEIGMSSVMLEDIKDSVFSGFVLRGRPENDMLDLYYKQYCFRANEVRKQICSTSSYTTRALTNGRLLSNVYITLPPTKTEQNAIATALNDIDKLIISLEKLIAKKRAIKQGTMQELLILRKRRLPGFSGEWKRKKLGDIISDISDGGTPSTVNPYNFGGGISWVVIDDIKDEIWQTRETLSEVGLRLCSARLWQPETIILSTGATIGEVGIAKVPVATKQGICGIVVNDNAVNIFLKYWFSLNKSYLISKAQGTSIKEVRPPILVKLDIKLPKIEEQVAIAQVLSDMDAEIAQLKQKLDKYKMLKQGMMQVLLTGKIRLI
ncbi:restriction endonuclease subunit S [bacterium]|nr:restriction endonuclease subunit S [bacterium]